MSHSNLQGSDGTKYSIGLTCSSVRDQYTLVHFTELWPTYATQLEMREPGGLECQVPWYNLVVFVVVT